MEIIKFVLNSKESFRCSRGIKKLTALNVGMFMLMVKHKGSGKDK